MAETPEQQQRRARQARLAKMTPQARAAYRSRVSRRARLRAEAAQVQKAAQKITVKVGIVEATVDAGADKIFGTDDDTVKLAPAGTADYSTLLVKQLRKQARDRDVPGYNNKMTKANLVKALRKLDKERG